MMPMLFGIGTRVLFRYTGESGVITAPLDEGMWQVKLDSDPDLEIPAFEEDLTRSDAPETNPPGPKFVPNKQEKPATPPPRRRLTASYHILKPKGLQIAFEPMPGRDGTVTRYKAWLINDTLQELLFELDVYTATRDVILLDDKIPGMCALELGDMLYDDLSDNPEVYVSIRRITTEGPEAPLHHTLKLRPKQFFNNLHTVPILNLPAYVFLLFDSFTAREPREKEDLRDYAKLNAPTPQRTRHRHGSSAPGAFNVEEFATFVPEIDLHIEKLMSGYTRLDKGEILRIQMLHLQRFLDKAVRLGSPKVFVIHGVGEGKLRESVASRLREYPEVAKFKNEFHHKYGYGATEVIFR